MEKKTNHLMVLYGIINIVVIILPIAFAVIQKAYKQFSFPVMPFYYLYMATPIVISILIFIKIMLQNKMPVWFSRLVNIICIVLFIIVVRIFYHAPGFLYFVSTYNLAAFIFYLQLCSFIYDIFFRK